jgi:phosphocarrier protein FPr
MIGVLLVSHSAGLASATAALVRQMTGERLRLELAAGAGEAGAELGTDASLILARLEDLADCAAIVVLMDIGSAVLSAELARDMADAALREKTHLSPAPFVEGAIAAGVAAASGLPLARVLAEAQSGIAQKQSALGAAEETKPSPSPAVSRTATIADPHGLHLRPAAALVSLAARFDAAVTLRCGARTARGDSLTSLMSLGAAGGALVTVEASGPKAQAAADALAARLAQAPAAPAVRDAPDAAPGPVPLSPGRAAGRLFVAERMMPPVPANPARDRAEAARRLDQALATVRAALTGSPILEAQAALLADPALREAAHQRIAQDGLNEAAAWQSAIDDTAAIYAALESPYLRERGRDVQEAGDAVLRILLGAGGIAWPEGDIIALVDDLTAAEAASLPDTVRGVLDRRGSATGHATILLRAAGIPALGHVALEPIPDFIAFDGETGDIWPDPDAALRETRATAAALGAGILRLPDGSDLELWANVSGERDAAAAARAGACGIGLARTEMLFLDRAEAPGIDEQAAKIAAMLRPFAGRPVVVRALDAGTDKPVPFLNLPRETNPALGVRGIRALLKNPAFFAAHLAAILRAGEGCDLRIMIPMVTFPEEMRAARELLAAICRERGLEPPPLGAMIEVPAAAIRVQDLVERCDFFSIGTNDLTQYVFAAERGSQNLALQADAGHAAILDLCAGIVARAGGKPVSVCGEAAGEPATASLLVQAGIRRLSMGAGRLGEIRQALGIPALVGG